MKKKMVKVTLIKSLIGAKPNTKATADSLGLVKIGDSVIHEDNAVLAQLGMPDMRLCIQYALTYPNRYETSVSALGLVGKKLEFFDPDEETFPLLPLARNAVKKGGNIPAAMNGANEAAVKAFLDHKISFTKLFDLVIGATENASYIASPTLDDILNTDASARDYVKSLISE